MTLCHCFPFQWLAHLPKLLDSLPLVVCKRMWSQLNKGVLMSEHLDNRFSNHWIGRGCPVQWQVWLLDLTTIFIILSLKVWNTVHKIFVLKFQKFYHVVCEEIGKDDKIKVIVLKNPLLVATIWLYYWTVIVDYSYNAYRHIVQSSTTINRNYYMFS